MTRHFVHPFDDDDFISGNGTIGLEIVEDLPDVDAVVAPIGGGGLLAGHRRARCVRCDRPRVSTPRSRRPRRPLAESLARGRGQPLRCLAGVVRRRRRRQVGAADDVAAAQRVGARVARRVARRRGAGDATGGGPGARHRRRARRRARSPRRCRQRSRSAATAVSSRSCRAATSIWRGSPNSPAHAADAAIERDCFPEARVCGEILVRFRRSQAVLSSAPR